MHWKDPNRPEPIKPERPCEKHLDTGPEGNIAEAGYRRIARAPRMRDPQIMPEARADRIEEIFSMPPILDMDGY